LLEHFTVGQVTLTPSFADKQAPGVREALAAVERAGVSMRVVKAGDRLTAGDVTLDVLHPPTAGPDGPENVRSLVLEIRHLGHTILLTGDLEGAGLEMLLATPPRPVDVMMAPHHGGKSANLPALAAWARPRLVVACQGSPPWPTQVPALYEARGTRYLGTWPHGAVTLVSHRTGLVAETFRTGQRLVVRAGAGR
jgi:competence protein ComEC